MKMIKLKKMEMFFKMKSEAYFARIMRILKDIVDDSELSDEEKIKLIGVIF